MIKLILGFLTLKDVTNLDTAVTRRAYRFFFLTALRGSRPLLNTKIICFESTLGFVLLRGQHVLHLNNAREIERSDISPLNWASETNNIDIVRMLEIEAKADVKI